jgi:hypothetical protein
MTKRPGSGRSSRTFQYLGGARLYFGAKRAGEELEFTTIEALAIDLVCETNKTSLEPRQSRPDCPEVR